MGWVDYAIIGIILLSTLIGVVRGFLREVFAFVIWLAALLVAWIFHKEFAGTLGGWIARTYPPQELTEELARWVTSPHLQAIAAFLILVLGMLILGAIVSHLLSMLLRKQGLIIGNRILGGVFGAARGMVLVAMVAFVGSLTPLPEDDWWRQSPLIGRFRILAEHILEHIPVRMTDWLKQL